MSSDNLSFYKFYWHKYNYILLAKSKKSLKICKFDYDLNLFKYLIFNYFIFNAYYIIFNF